MAIDIEPQADALEREVYKELVWEPSVDALNVDVMGRPNGVIVLTGVVRNYAEKVTAERAARRIKGVQSVVNELDVRLASSHERSDVDLADAVVQALEWDVLVPPRRIQARVADGCVRLEGQVDWNYQREAAAEAVHRLAGVKGVTNLIKVSSQLTVPNVKALIEAALRRSAELDAQAIDVDVQGRVVMLRGRVQSWAERDAAETAAWSAPGVTGVLDEIEVAPAEA